MLTDEERNILYDMMVDDKEDGYRAKIILLKYEGYTVPEIRRATNHIMTAIYESGYIVSTRKD